MRGAAIRVYYGKVRVAGGEGGEAVMIALVVTFSSHCV